MKKSYVKEHVPVTKTEDKFMKKALKRLTIFMVIAIMALGGFAISGCGKEEKVRIVTNGDFRLTIAVNKTMMHVGDTIEINATLENMGEQNIPIELTDAATYNGGMVENIFNLDICSKKETHHFGEISVAVKQRAAKIIESNVTIMRTFEYVATEAGSFKIAIAVFFYTGDDFLEFFKLESSSINISVS